MNLFPELIFQFLIYGSLVATAVGAIVLVCLLVVDFKNGKIW